MQASFSICEKGRNHDSLSLTLSPSNQPAIMPRRSPFHRKVVLVFSICTLVWIWGCAFFFGLPEVKVDLPMEPVVSVDALFAGLSEHAMVDTTTEYHSNTKKITSNETTTSNQTTVFTKWTSVDNLMPDTAADNSSSTSSSSLLSYNNTPKKIDQSMYNMGVSITLQDIKDFIAGTIVDTIVNKHGQNFHQKPIINRYNSSIPFKSNNNNTGPPVDCLSARLLISFIEASSDPLDKSLQAAAFRDELALFKATISKSCNISRTATGRNETGNKEANKENFTGSRKYYFCSSINVKGGKSGANKSDQLTWLTQWLNKWVTPEEAELLLDVYSVGLQAAHLLFYLLLIPVVIAFYFKLLDRYFESPPPPPPPPMANVAETAQFPVENVEVEEEHEEKNEEEEGRKLEEALNFYRNFQQKYRKETLNSDDTMHLLYQIENAVEAKAMKVTVLDSVARNENELPREVYLVFTD